MKVRTLCMGLVLSLDDFEEMNLLRKFELAKNGLMSIAKVLAENKYEVQTLRISLNPMENWLFLNENWTPEVIREQIVKKVGAIVDCLVKVNLEFCSLGGLSNSKYFDYIPEILGMSTRLFSSLRFSKDSNSVGPDFKDCLEAARCVHNIFNNLGNLGNFRNTVSFNYDHGSPFFPASYSAIDYGVSVGLENGDLLFMGFYAATSLDNAKDNLVKIFQQVYPPLQDVLLSACNFAKESAGIPLSYLGLDISVNPGLSIPDSVGAGLEALLQSILCPIDLSNIGLASTHGKVNFGQFGTLGAVSTVTCAIKEFILSSEVKVIGYNGLMLPVMEDLILAQRTDFYRLRDLLLFSSVCGVGLDTVPIPGCTSVEAIASVLLETSSMSYKLQKPLSVRLLPMKDRLAGDYTDVENPYLCNCKILSIY